MHIRSHDVHNIFHCNTPNRTFVNVSYHHHHHPIHHHYPMVYHHVLILMVKLSNSKLNGILIPLMPSVTPAPMHIFLTSPPARISSRISRQPLDLASSIAMSTTGDMWVKMMLRDQVILVIYLMMMARHVMPLLPTPLWRPPTLPILTGSRALSHVHVTALLVMSLAAPIARELSLLVSLVVMMSPLKYGYIFSV